MKTKQLDAELGRLWRHLDARLFQILTHVEYVATTDDIKACFFRELKGQSQLPANGPLFQQVSRKIEQDAQAHALVDRICELTEQLEKAS